MLLQRQKQQTTHSTTELRTLWSETLMDMLYDAIQYNWSPNAVREILKELHNKGYKITKVMRKLNYRFGESGPQKLRQIMGKGR